MALVKSLILNLNKIVKKIYNTGYLPMPHEIKERVNAVCGLDGYEAFIENRNFLPEVFVPQEGYNPVYLIDNELGITVNSPLECAVYVHGGWYPPIYDPVDMTIVFLDPITTYPLIIIFLLVLSSLLSLRKFIKSK